MATLCLKGYGDINQIADIIRTELATKNGVSCTLVDEVKRTIGNSTVFVMVFEKYYARASNRVSLTISISSDGDIIYVDAISAGGGQGWVFKLDWGAEQEFVAVIKTILAPYNFE